MFFIQSCSKNESGSAGLSSNPHIQIKSAPIIVYSHDTTTNQTYEMKITKYQDGTIDLVRSVATNPITTTSVIMDKEVVFKYDSLAKVVSIYQSQNIELNLYVIPFDPKTSPEKAPSTTYEVTCDCTGYGEGGCTPSTAYNTISCLADRCSYCKRTVVKVSGGSKSPLTGTSGYVFIYATGVN